MRDCFFDVVAVGAPVAVGLAVGVSFVLALSVFFPVSLTVAFVVISVDCGVVFEELLRAGADLG